MTKTLQVSRLDRVQIQIEFLKLEADISKIPLVPEFGESEMDKYSVISKVKNIQDQGAMDKI